MTTPRSAPVATTLAVMTAAALCAPSAASAGEPAAPAACDDGPAVTVVVDPNEVGGPDRVTCVPGGGTAVELFDEAGVVLEYQPGLQDFVCRIDGTPTDRPCTAGDSYWSLWWAAPDGPWTYATLGVRSLEVPDGGLLGFSWHEGDADAAPPDAVGEPPDERPADSAPADDAAADPADDADDGESGLPWWAAGLAVVVLAAAAIVPVLRRRRS